MGDADAVTLRTVHGDAVRSGDEGGDAGRREPRAGETVRRTTHTDNADPSRATSTCDCRATLEDRLDGDATPVDASTGATHEACRFGDGKSTNEECRKTPGLATGGSGRVNDPDRAMTCGTAAGITALAVVGKVKANQAGCACTASTRLDGKDGDPGCEVCLCNGEPSLSLCAEPAHADFNGELSDLAAPCTLR